LGVLVEQFSDDAAWRDFECATNRQFLKVYALGQDIDEVSRTLTQTDILYVVDAKLGSIFNRFHISQEKDYYLTPMTKVLAAGVFCIKIIHN
jgi:hypothetical protein